MHDSNFEVLWSAHQMISRIFIQWIYNFFCKTEFVYLFFCRINVNSNIHFVEEISRLVCSSKIGKIIRWIRYSILDVLPLTQGSCFSGRYETNFWTFLSERIKLNQRVMLPADVIWIDFKYNFLTRYLLFMKRKLI